MAYVEMSLTIAKVMYYFDFAKPDDSEGVEEARLGEGWGPPGSLRGRRDEFQLYEGIVVEHKGPNLRFTPRGEHWRELMDE